MVEMINETAFKILPVLSTTENILFSPISLIASLVTLTIGCDQITMKEILSEFSVSFSKSIDNDQQLLSVLNTVC